MVTQHLVGETVQVSLLAVSGYAGMASGVLVERFGLSRTQAERILDLGYGVLSTGLPYDEAAKLKPLLAALGLQVQIQAAKSAAPIGDRAIAIRIRDQRLAPRIIPALAALLDPRSVTEADLDGPEGLVLSGLTPPRMLDLSKALRRMPGVVYAVSDMRSPIYDLFSDRVLTEDDFTGILNELRLLGCGTGHFGDAIGLGLEERVKDRMLTRFANTGLFAVNRAFQRYDLLVIGKGSLSHQDFADFMATRPVAKGLAPRDLCAALPLQLETWLTRAAATQFLTDYRSIGIQAAVRLIRQTPPAQINL